MYIKCEVLALSGYKLKEIIGTLVVNTGAYSGYVANRHKTKNYTAASIVLQCARREPRIKSTDHMLECCLQGYTVLKQAPYIEE